MDIKWNPTMVKKSIFISDSDLCISYSFRVGDHSTAVGYLEYNLLEFRKLLLKKDIM